RSGDCDRPGRPAADHQAGHCQTPCAAHRRRVGGPGARGATPGALSVTVGADAGGAALPGRPRPRLGQLAGRAAQTPRLTAKAKAADRTPPNRGATEPAPHRTAEPPNPRSDDSALPYSVRNATAVRVRA